MRLPTTLPLLLALRMLAGVNASFNCTMYSNVSSRTCADVSCDVVGQYLAGETATFDCVEADTIHVDGVNGSVWWARDESHDWVPVGNMIGIDGESCDTHLGLCVSLPPTSSGTSSASGSANAKGPSTSSSNSVKETMSSAPKGTDEPSSTGQSHKSTPAAAIGGGVGGGIAVILILLVWSWCARSGRRRRLNVTSVRPGPRRDEEHIVGGELPSEPGGMLTYDQHVPPAVYVSQATMWEKAAASGRAPQPMPMPTPAPAPAPSSMPSPPTSSIAPYTPAPPERVVGIHDASTGELTLDRGSPHALIAAQRAMWEKVTGAPSSLSGAGNSSGSVPAAARSPDAVTPGVSAVQFRAMAERVAQLEAVITHESTGEVPPPNYTPE